MFQNVGFIPTVYKTGLSVSPLRGKNSAKPLENKAKVGSYATHVLEMKSVKLQWIFFRF